MTAAERLDPLLIVARLARANQLRVVWITEDPGFLARRLEEELTTTHRDHFMVAPAGPLYRNDNGGQIRFVGPDAGTELRTLTADLVVVDADEVTEETALNFRIVAHGAQLGTWRLP